MPHREYNVISVDDLIKHVESIRREWEPALPWFRGEASDDEYPLTPTLHRVQPGFHYDENWLLQTFRQEAPILNLPLLPETGRIDQWMFLARHVSLPTRLLDWTEGALIALNFALRGMDDNEPVPPVVWMLNPFKLIGLTPQDPPPLPNIYPLTWVEQTTSLITDSSIETVDFTDGQERRQMKVHGEIHDVALRRNIGLSNFRAAWSAGPYAYETAYPVPIRPAYVHPRMIAQLSCFTIYGTDHRSLVEMLEGHDCLIKFIIEMPKQETLAQLRTLGVTYVNLMPDADGLAKDILQRYPPAL